MYIVRYITLFLGICVLLVAGTLAGFDGPKAAPTALAAKLIVPTEGRVEAQSPAEADRFIIEDLETDGPFGRLMMIHASSTYYFDEKGIAHNIDDIFAAAIKKLGAQGYRVEIKETIIRNSSGSYGSVTIAIIVEVTKK